MGSKTSKMARRDTDPTAWVTTDYDQFSAYDLEGEPWSDQIPDAQTWMYAHEARSQVKQTKKYSPGNKKRYPGPFQNKEQLPINIPPPPKSKGKGNKTTPPAAKPIVHTPLVPGQSRPWKSGPPGSVRAVYTEGHKQDFQVMQHDSKLPTTGRGDHDFSLRPYVPAAPCPKPQKRPGFY
ncbi:uncharacterized protein PgNI_03045 [Pyricularia grisea]|uniref:Uncharacterized protein n=1 Tax=Pyricularia grisea TaxID=148305 RepID=A0A6P8BC46_PYRGI|nr:uncharacterized protein PgNI_03045 [Pyricularia grisea]TLD13262.1 hypothetical protein PgNI_03045 [Pyricularia grisea]